MTKQLFYYLLAANILSAIFFVLDKQKAIQKKRRISEMTLHLFELAGGVFINITLMYLIRHKNKKTSYFMITYAILAIWCVAMFFYFK